MDEMKREIIIVAPHPDDEIIGSYEVLMNKDISPIIIYTTDVDNDRRQEALNLKNFIPNIKVQLFQKEIPQPFKNPNSIFYFPDPAEFHPEHRRVGIIGEQLFRDGLEVIFYTTNMQTYYIHEVPNWKDKRDLLNKTYPSQKSLWKNDHKYFLFEGRCAYIR